LGNLIRALARKSYPKIIVRITGTINEQITPWPKAISVTDKRLCFEISPSSTSIAAAPPIETDARGENRDKTGINSMANVSRMRFAVNETVPSNGECISEIITPDRLYHPIPAAAPIVSFPENREEGIKRQASHPKTNVPEITRAL